MRKMSPVKLIAVLLIIGGALGLAYGGFSYTRNTHEVKVGPIDLALQEKKTIDVPVWAGIAAIVVGGALLLMGNRPK
jgi:TRAP-type C4-dicarboxylate transport system permease small subunit